MNRNVKRNLMRSARFSALYIVVIGIAFIIQPLTPHHPYHSLLWNRKNKCIKKTESGKTPDPA